MQSLKSRINRVIVVDFLERFSHWINGIAFHHHNARLKKSTPFLHSLRRVIIVYRALLIKHTNWTNIAIGERRKAHNSELFLILSFGQWKSLPKRRLVQCKLDSCCQDSHFRFENSWWRIQSIWLHYRFDKHYFSCSLLTNKSVSVYTKRGGSWQTNDCLISRQLQDFCLLHELNLSGA